MIKLEPRNTQTRVKHEILSRYLDTWGGIIVGGLTKARKPADWHFIYVDCFSYLGRYSGELEDIYHDRKGEVDGSPLIGIKALDRLLEHAERKMGVRIRVNCILIEKDKRTYQGLLETLQKSGYEARLKETNNLTSLERGQIAVLNADATLLANDLLTYTSNLNAWAFYLIDPRGPSGIPYDFVKKIVSQDHHDVMINFIYQDLLRKTGMCIKDNPNTSEQQLVDNWTRAFNGDWWIELAKKTLQNEEMTRNIREALDGIPMSDMEEGTPFTDEELSAFKEQKFVSAYRDVLRTMDKGIVNKLVNLRFGEKERTMFYLFLTTHDPTGALSLNRILSDAKYLENELRYQLKMAKQTAKKNIPSDGQMKMMFWDEVTVKEEVSTPEPEITPRPSKDEISAFIFEKFSGRSATRKEVYKELADTFYFPEEVDKGLRHLRKNGQAQFEGDPKHSTLIIFS